MERWWIRPEGAPHAVEVNSLEDVIAGLRQGRWLPGDEIKQADEKDWQPIYAHPALQEVVEELETPPRESGDETHLDMNPLIDVCLVLLIFFMLTITYASLERAIDVPPVNPDRKGPARVEYKDIKDQVFVVRARVEGERTVIKVEQTEVPLERLEAEIKRVISTTGRREMVLDVDKLVPWGVVAAILDAAKGNGVRNILNNRRS